MVQETYDWSTAYSDEQSGTTTTFTSGTGETVDVAVAQPDPLGVYRSNRDGFETTTNGGFTGGFFESGVNFGNNNQTVTQTIDFTNNTESGADSVSDVSFTLYDIDSTASGSFQDEVTILAFDALGNPLTVTLTAVNSGVVSVSGGTATSILGAGSGPQGSVSSTQTDGNVNVSISGEVASIQIIYGNGPGAQTNPGNQVIGFGDLSFDLVPPPVCFVAGTHIRTANGETPVELLKQGDMVMTLDHGLQPLRWIGSRVVAGRGTLQPVHFAAGAIGNLRSLTVSPQHRVLLSGGTLELMTGQNQVLVAAQHLVNGHTITQAETPSVEYFHILFDRHEVVFAEGHPCESLFLGERAERSIGRSALRDVEKLFPELFRLPPNARTAARYCLKKHEAKLVA